MKNGIWEAGGVPYNLPVVSLGETQVKPTAMLWRNLAAMAMEEMFRANPVDGLVLLGGCDKTIPALLMAAASVDLPAVVVPGGPMLTGYFRGEALGCGTDVWRLSEEARAGTITNGQFIASEQSMIRGKGHCNTMGTASTMAVVAEALGMTIPGFAGTPAADARLLSMSHETGRLIVDMVDRGPQAERHHDPRLVPQRDRRGGGGRRLDELGHPPAGDRRPARHRPHARRLRCGGSRCPRDGEPSAERRVPDGRPPPRRRRARAAVTGEGHAASRADHRDGAPLVDYLVDQPVYDDAVILPRDAPLMADAGIAVLRGNLAPGGAIIKPSAATPELLHHVGPAVVFDSIEDCSARIDDPGLDVTADSVLVLRGCGPRGYPGMPEVGNMPLPRKLLEAGRARHGAHQRRAHERHRIRHGHPARRPGGRGRRSARPSSEPATSSTSTSRDADCMSTSATRSCAARAQSATSAAAYAAPVRGWAKLYVDHVMQADTGADLDFLVGSSGDKVSRESH